jgi:hypothetical protein
MRACICAALALMGCERESSRLAEPPVFETPQEPVIPMETCAADARISGAFEASWIRIEDEYFGQPGFAHVALDGDRAYVGGRSIAVYDLTTNSSSAVSLALPAGESLAFADVIEARDGAVLFERTWPLDHQARVMYRDPSGVIVPVADRRGHSSSSVSSRYLTDDGRVLLWDGARVVELARGSIRELFATAEGETVQIDSAGGVDVFAVSGETARLWIRRHGGAREEFAAATRESWAVLASSHVYWGDADAVWRAPISAIDERELLEGCTIGCDFSDQQCDPRGEGNVGLICGDHLRVYRGTELVRSFWRDAFLDGRKLGRDLLAGTSKGACWNDTEVDAARLDDSRIARFRDANGGCELSVPRVDLQVSASYVMWRAIYGSKVHYASHSTKWCED